MTLPPFLAALLAESPSIQAAMKAGKKTSISAIVIRANGQIEDLGTISWNEGPWATYLRSWMGTGKVVLRYVYKGKEIERANF